MSGKRRSVTINCVLYALILVIIAVSSNALEGFSAQNLEVTPVTGTYILSEPCKPITFEFQLKNTGSFPETYSISLENAKPWTSLAQKSIFLLGDDNWEIVVSAQPPCEVYGQFGSNLIVKAHGSKFATKIPLKYEILRNYQFDLIAGDYKEIKRKNESEIQFTDTENVYEICEKENKTIPLLLKNLVDVDNSYRIEFEGEKWSQISGNRLNLEGMQEGMAEVRVEPPLGMYGNFSFIVKAFSKRGKMFDKEEFNVNVRPCYSIDVDIGNEGEQEEEEVLCQDDENSYDVNIFNNGEFDEDIQLSLSGSSCVSLSSDLVNVDNSNEEDVELIFDPNCKEKGKTEVTVKAELADEPRINAEDKIQLSIHKLEKCYETKVSKSWFYTEGEDTRTAKIKNVGAKGANYNVLLEGPSWITVDEGTKDFRLEPDEIKSIDLNLNPSEEVEQGLYSLNIRASADDKVIYSRRSTVQYGQVELEDVFKFYWYYFVAATIILITIIIRTIKKIRKKRRKYSEKEWVIINKDEKNILEVEKNFVVVSVGVESKKEFNNVKLSAEQFKKNKTKMFLNEKVYKYFEVKAENVDEKGLKETIIKFKVEKKWLDKKKLNQNQIELKRLVNGKWVSLDVARSKSDEEYVYYNYSGKRFGHFAIIAKAEKKEDTKKTEDKKVEAKRAEPKKEAKKVPKTNAEKKKKLKTLFLNTIITVIVLIALVTGVMFGYIYYIIGGVVGLFIIIGTVSLINHIKSKPKVKKEKTKDKKVEAKRAEPKKEAKKAQKKEKSKVEFKKEYLLGAVVLLILITIIIGFIKISPQGIWEQINFTQPETTESIDSDSEMTIVEGESITLGDDSGLQEDEGTDVVPEMTEEEKMREDMINQLLDEQAQVKNEGEAQVQEENVQEEALTEEEITQREEYLQSVLDESISGATKSEEEIMREEMISQLLNEQNKVKDEEVIMEKVEEYGDSVDETEVSKSFFKDYKDYIIAGVGILIVLIIFFSIKGDEEEKVKRKGKKDKPKKAKKKKKKKSKFWKSVVDFFLEEYEEPNKNNKNKKK